MRKLTILATTAAVAINAISPAFATSLPSWNEVITKAGTEGGGWVRGHHSNEVFKPLAGRDGFLFGNVLANDIPLPRVTDVTAVLNAAKQATKPIIVASNDWLLPSNPMLCEIAEQVKMTCGDFTYNFYKYSQKDDDGNWSGLEESTAELEKVQAQVISYVESLDMTTDSLNVKSEAVIALENVIASLETDLEANAVAIAALKAQITTLKENAELDADKIDDLNSQIKAKQAEIEELGTTKSKLEKANENLQKEKTTLQDKLDAAQTDIDALAKIRDDAKQALADAGIQQMEDLQSMINALVDARNALQVQIDVLPAEFTTVQDIVDAWDAQKTAIANYKTALGDYATAAKAFQAGVESVTTKVTEYPEGLEVTNKNHTVTISIQDGYVLVKNTDILNDQDANVANFKGITSTVEGNNVTLAVAEGYKLLTVEQYKQDIAQAKASVVANVNTLDGLEVVTNGANVEISVKEGWTIVTKDTILNDQDATHNADTIKYISATVNGNEVTISVDEGYMVVENGYIPAGYKQVSDEEHVVSKTVKFTQSDIDTAVENVDKSHELTVSITANGENTSVTEKFTVNADGTGSIDVTAYVNGEIAKALTYEEVKYANAQAVYDAGVESVTIDQNAVYTAYEDDSITFKVGASNGESMTFKVTTTDFNKDGFHLEFNNGGDVNFEFDIFAQAYKDFIASLSGNGEFSEADLAAEWQKGHDKAVTQFVSDMNDQAQLWSPETVGTYKVQGDISNFAADVWDNGYNNGKTNGQAQGEAIANTQWQDKVTNAIKSKLQDFNKNVDSKITNEEKLNNELDKLVAAAQADLKADADAYQSLVAQNAQNPGVMYVANLITEAQTELAALQADAYAIEQNTKHTIWDDGFNTGYALGHKDGKAGNTNNANASDTLNPFPLD